MPEITALVPSYNHAPYIERTLRSVFKQTCAPKKLIVIDDGSKDESVAVIERVLKDCPFECDLIARRNRGLCATLNEGLAEADTEYFAYLGSDDLWLPEFLEKQAKLLGARLGAVLAFGHAFLIDEQDYIIDRTNNWTEFADGNMLPLLLKGVIFSSPTVLYRTAAVRKYGWNEDARLEDYELYLKLSGDGEFARSREILSAWRQHENNTSDDFALMLREQIDAQNRVAPMLGIGDAELRASQCERNYAAVFDLLRAGDKKEARRLFIENSAGKTLSETAGLKLRMMVPGALFQWNRRRKRRAAAKRNGKLKI